MVCQLPQYTEHPHVLCVCFNSILDPVSLASLSPTFESLPSQTYSKTPKLNRFGVEESVAAGLGLEPRLLGPKPSVLPLDDPAIM